MGKGVAVGVGVKVALGITGDFVAATGVRCGSGVRLVGVGVGEMAGGRISGVGEGFTEEGNAGTGTGKVVGILVISGCTVGDTGVAVGGAK